MKDIETLSPLRDTILSNLAVLHKIEKYYREYTINELPEENKRSYHHAVVIADFFERYYTCLETIFLRISQHFENNLDPSRWHHNLLEKMKIRIDGIREQAISDETYPLLVEFLKFRHFKRYYFDIEYDWDKLEYLQKKFDALIPKVHDDIGRFIVFLDRLIKLL
jgi:hypothetical protein